VVSEQGRMLAYTVTEGSETGKSNNLCSSWTCSGILSKSQCDSRTQTEGPSPYWYRLNTMEGQANTTSCCTHKATNASSMCSSTTDTNGTCIGDRTS
jgi:hypothetical protein